jgi:DNA-binding NarL/FixJ family response regulator
VDKALGALVVDDDEGTRTLIVELLERGGFDVAAADSGERALALIDDGLKPELASLDVQMPGVSGYEVCIDLRRRFGDRIAIMFVSGSRSEPFDRVAGLRLGADDYLTKPFDPEELVARAHALVRRLGAKRQPPTTEHSLTPRELEVLCLLGEGRQPATIAGDLHISSKTVAKHIERIIKKLEVNSRSQAIAYAFREGLIP